ncbi:MAG: sulfite exporter TauE/SafE family protein [Ignavibacteriales bacterium]|nr:sulfite exporter TauE/SafE family protein [Ignavibacteriales bacterium]
MFLLSGFLIGLVGSLHCIGMWTYSSCDKQCRSKTVYFSPSKSFIPFWKSPYLCINGFSFWAPGNSYQTFRNAASCFNWNWSYNSYLDSTSCKDKSKFSNLSLVNRYNAQVKTALSKVLSSGKTRPYFVIGLVNGFLPCGLVYAGLAGAVATGDPLQGFFYMFLFGVGTMPALFIFSFAPALRKYLPKLNTRKLIPALSLVLGIIFILRGLNLGIPFVSPKFEDVPKTEQIAQPDCCH